MKRFPILLSCTCPVGPAIVLSLALAGCRQRVISEKGYSPQHFQPYKFVPRDKPTTDTDTKRR